MEHRPDFYTVRQFVAVAGISRRTFDEWLQAGFTPRMVRDGPRGWWRIPHDEWVRWFAALEKEREERGRRHVRHPMERRGRAARSNGAPAPQQGEQRS